MIVRFAVLLGQQKAFIASNSFSQNRLPNIRQRQIAYLNWFLNQLLRLFHSYDGLRSQFLRAVFFWFVFALSLALKKYGC
jgi:hypothetical protein